SRSVRNAVNTNPFFHQVLRQRLGEIMNCAFSGSVVEQLFVAFKASLRAAVYDCAAGLHVRNGGLGHVEVSKDIGAKGALPLLFGEVFDALLMLLECGVIDQDIELAKLPDGLLDRLAAELRVRNIS